MKSKKNHKRRMGLVFTLILAGLLSVSCAKKKDDSSSGSDKKKDSGGTTGGNPSAKTTIQSSAYTNDGSVAFFMKPAFDQFQKLFWIPSALAAPVTDFRFCITQMKVSTSSGASSGEVILGLIDVSNSGVPTTWGTIELPEGETIKSVSFEVHKDSERCSGENFSVSYNGDTITQDLEFKFNFSPAVTVVDGDVITLGLNNIAKAIEDASANGHFNNEQIGAYMEDNAVGTGEVEDD